jgi:hypothetical protein
MGLPLVLLLPLFLLLLMLVLLLTLILLILILLHVLHLVFRRYERECGHGRGHGGQTMRCHRNTNIP